MNPVIEFKLPDNFKLTRNKYLNHIWNNMVDMETGNF